MKTIKEYAFGSIDPRVEMMLRQALTEMREECAKVAEEYSAQMWDDYKCNHIPEAQGKSDGADEVAERIRRVEIR